MSNARYPLISPDDLPHRQREFIQAEIAVLDNKEIRPLVVDYYLCLFSIPHVENSDGEILGPEDLLVDSAADKYRDVVRRLGEAGIDPWQLWAKGTRYR